MHPIQPESAVNELPWQKPFQKVTWILSKLPLQALQKNSALPAEYAGSLCTNLILTLRFYAAAVQAILKAIP